MQTTYTSPIEARGAIMAYINFCSPECAAEIIPFANCPSPIEAIVMTAEYLYAHHEDLDPAGRDLCGSLAAFCAAHAFWGMGTEQRGARIALAMRRENGEEGGFPAANLDPAPHVAFAPASIPLPPVV